MQRRLLEYVRWTFGYEEKMFGELAFVEVIFFQTDVIEGSPLDA